MPKLLSVCALILAAAALALSAARPSPAGSAGVQPSSREAFRGGPDPEEVDLRLRAMEDTVAQLSRRVMEVERAARHSGVVPSGGAAALAQGGAGAAHADVGEELRRLRADLHSVATAEALGSDRGRELLKDVVRSVQAEVQADRVRDFRERQQAAREERLQRLVREARLTGNQERDLRALLEAEAHKRNELLERMRAGERGRELFGELRAVREQNDQQARALLGPDQLEHFSAMREEEQRSFGGGGGGGGGRRGVAAQ